MSFVRMKPPVGVTVGLGANDVTYYVDQRGFANVDSGSESKLTAEGWVRDDYVDPPSGPAYEPVMATKSLTGMVTIPSAKNALESTVVRQRRPSALVRPLGYNNNSSSTNVTRHGALILPFRPRAVKMRLYNGDIGGTKTMRGAVATAGDIADPIGNALTWSQATFSGAATASVSAATNGNMPTTVMASYDSDIIAIDPAPYGAGTVMMYRTHAIEQWGSFFVPPNLAVADMTLAKMGATGYFLAGVEAVSNPALFVNPNAHASLPPAGLIIYTDAMVRKISIYGSSTAGGSGNTVDFGWSNIASRQMSTDNLAYLFAQCGISGSTTQNVLKRFDADMSGGVYPDFAALWLFSPNDADVSTASALPRLKCQALYFADECIKRGIVPVLATAQAATGQSGTSNANRKAINQFGRDLAASGACRIFDIADLLCNESAAVGTWKDPSLIYPTDGANVHPGNAAQGMIATLAAAVFS